MSRKHYQMVASALLREVKAADEAGDVHTILAVQRIANDLARMFKAENSNFDRVRFLSACNLDPYSTP